MESWKFSTWQFFLHIYNMWYMWQIWGLHLLLQKTGKTIIKYLKKRGISGDDLRREMWVHDEATTPKANRKKKGKGYDISFALGHVQPQVVWVLSLILLLLKTWWHFKCYSIVVIPKLNLSYFISQIQPWWENSTKSGVSVEKELVWMHPINKKVVLNTWYVYVIFNQKPKGNELFTNKVLMQKVSSNIQSSSNILNTLSVDEFTKYLHNQKSREWN